MRKYIGWKRKKGVDKYTGERKKRRKRRKGIKKRGY